MSRITQQFDNKKQPAERPGLSLDAPLEPPQIQTRLMRLIVGLIFNAGRKLDDPTKGMLPEDALHYWATKRNPWSVNGRSGRFPYDYRLDATTVEVNAVGNVTKMPPLVGVPCFGQPLPHLRFVHMWNYQKTSGKPRPGRCKTCSFREACAKVVDARVSCDPELKDKADAYVKARRDLSNVAIRNGRAEANGRPRNEHQDSYLAARSKEQSASTRIRAELTKYRWVSVNDRSSVAVDELRAVKERATARKARMRMKRAGTVPAEHFDALSEAADHRVVLLKDYAAQLGADRQLRRVPVDSLVRDVAVWKAAEQMRWNGVPATAYAIAQHLGAVGIEVNRDRQRVGRSLRRIARYETEILAGRTGPLWEPFDPERWIKHAHQRALPVTKNRHNRRY